MDTTAPIRRDVDTRKVIEVVTANVDAMFSARLDKMLKLRGVVFWERLAVVLGLSAVVIIGAAWTVTTMACSGAEATALSARTDVSTLRKETGEGLQLVREENRETREDIRGLYRSVRDDRPSPRLAAPVPDLPPNPISRE